MTELEAKEIYLNSDCSYFVMCTNHYSSYIQYRRLELPRAQEEIWKNERIQMLYLEICKTGNFRLFNRMYEIAVDFHDYNNLVILIDAFRHIRQPMRSQDCISVAETIIGKRNTKARSGLVYWAYDNGQKGLAIYLMDQALELIYQPGEKGIEMERRIRKARRTCKRIITELRLNFTKRYLMHCYHF